MQTSVRNGRTAIQPQVARTWRVALALFALLVLGGGQGAQAGELYLSGGLGVTGGNGETGGSTPFFENTGDDIDSSATYSVAFGFQMPLNEPLPEQWQDVIPNWPIMAEFEATGGRDYEFLTEGGDPYRTDFTTWTVMHNLRFDVPVATPFEYAFGRLPILQPLTFYATGGVGIAINEVETTDNVSRGKDGSINFAWQAGGGFSYEVSRYVSIDVGYRYVDMGSEDFELKLGSTEFGNFELHTTAHEFASAVRVRFFGIALNDRAR